MADQEMKSASETTEDMDVEMQNAPQKQPDKESMAEAKKAEGNREYGLKNYDAAIDLYTKAIGFAPHIATFYGNRSAAYMMITQYDKALEDALISIRINDKFVKGHYRAAKCYLAMGSASNALRELQKVLELDAKNKDAKNDMKAVKMVQDFEASALEAYDKKDYRKVVFCMRNVLEVSPAGIFFRVLKAEALALMEKYSDAESEAVELLRKDPNNTDALYVRGLCLYYQDNVDKAYQHFTQVMKRDPDHKKARQILKKAKALQAKKKEGNDAFSNGHHQRAYQLYSEALDIDPLNKSTNAKLYYNRAIVGSKIGKTEGAIEDCSQAINLDHTYTKAYLKRANCYMDSEQYEEAVRDYEALCKKDRSSREYRRLLEKGKVELKKSKRKDYYKILGIHKGAGEDEIKKAYKKEALKHHPDRHPGASDEQKKEAEKQFKEINEAYSILSDSKKRIRYDSGQDLEDGCGMPDDFDPNSIFQAFFGGPGGFAYNFGGPGGPGGGGGPYRQSEGYPGGGNFRFTFG